MGGGVGGVSLGNPPRSCDVKPNGQLIKKMIKRLTVHSPLFFRKIVEIERFALRPAILPMSPLWLMFVLCQWVSKLLWGWGAVWEEARKTESIKSFIFRSGTIITNIGQEKKIKKLKFSMKSLTLFFTIHQYTFHSTFDLNLIKFYKNAAYIN